MPRNHPRAGIKDPNFRVHEKASKDPRSDLRYTLRASSKVKPRRSPAARTTQALASLLCFRHPSHSLATLYPPYGTRLGQARHRLCRRAAGLISLSTAAPGADTSPGRLQRSNPTSDTWTSRHHHHAPACLDELQGIPTAAGWPADPLTSKPRHYSAAAPRPLGHAPMRPNGLGTPRSGAALT